GFYSSATLVKDARRHGVRTRPVDLGCSQWRCVVEPDDSIRLGFCVVHGLQEEHARELLAQRAQRPFASIDDFKMRVRLHKDELRALAEIGALNALAAHRRDALWQAERELLPEDDLFAEKVAQASSLPEVARASSLPLEGDRTLEACATLRAMSPGERLQADYRIMSMSTGPHPMALLRDRAPECWRARDLADVRTGLRVRIAGAVICRQRPGTAKGFVFISLEDETGIANAIVTPAMFERERLLITHERFLIIEGIAQNHEGVIHVRAETITPLDAQDLAAAGSHDFR
nr:error-prone DNA polymerase [Verrucomicrobiota bacterium]